MSDAATADNANPEGWRSYLDQLRQQGLLTDEHELALQRYFGERENQLAHRMQAISAEYDQRVADDGKDAAIEWLTAQGRAMGQSDREEIERLLSSIGLPLPERGAPAAVAAPSQPAADPAATGASAPTEGPDSVTLEFHEPDPVEDKDAHLRRPRQRPNRR